ncbi:hypothetical protein [Microbacterium paludicola]|uniref:TolB family protein n=1 Tax=Microbacterium paludicola TaxID=300019 RepID=UPI0031D01C53
MTDGALPRMRGLILTGIVVAVTAAVVLFGLNAYAAHVSARDTAPPVAQADLATVRADPHIVFRSTASGADHGRVALVPLTDPDGPRAITGATCDRVYAAAGQATCLRTERGVVTTFQGSLLDASWNEVASWPLAGLPSRTRMSSDGSLIATTSFVTGHSYAGTGFSTRTEVRTTAGRDYGSIEDFTLLVDGTEYDAVDRNMWGVTFTGGDGFYATAASAGRTWLVRGDLEERTLSAVRENAECPSISPDGERVAYKKSRGDGEWAIAVLDLATGRERMLGEARSVDDQPEWLDDDTVLYGLPRADEAGVTDVWAIDLAPGAEPRVLIPQAWSPSVVR